MGIGAPLSYRVAVETGLSLTLVCAGLGFVETA